LKEPAHSKLSYVILLTAIGVMLYFTIRYYNSSEHIWGKSALMQFSLGFSGLIGTQVLHQQPIFPSFRNERNFRKIDFNIFFHSLGVLAIIMIVQLVFQVTLSFTRYEAALYYVFAAPCEESFFRGFMLQLFLKSEENIAPKKVNRKFSFWKIMGCILQAGAFTAIHTQYYDNLGMLTTVFVGGFFLGMTYVIWRDLTGNILGHFILNIISVRDLLVRF
jgi:membrane protease YdiL (CAAX protease family)